MLSLVSDVIYISIMKAFFTGHRDIVNIKDGINQLIDIAWERGVTEFMNGMALGVDQEAAEILIERELNWTAVIPCQNQDRLWSPQQKLKYQELLKSASNKIVLYPEYTPGVMQARDIWMVKHSDICLAVYDGRLTGGAALTVNLAIAHNLPVIQFNPRTLETAVIEPRQLSLF
ncbi:SLOG family protein [Anabaena sp. UHCC 0187]|uniref:SLOG family protein n=1 Tax=Anabaena sp. UHCC 0187 TaxID=2590018 RepID=UPI0020C28E5B|nr:SLOG family protein [Anabaena sp. UHCC 0187]